MLFIAIPYLHNATAGLLVATARALQAQHFKGVPFDTSSGMLRHTRKGVAATNTKAKALSFLLFIFIFFYLLGFIKSFQFNQFTIK
jgi:hypothetical protein